MPRNSHRACRVTGTAGNGIASGSTDNIYMTTMRRKKQRRTTLSTISYRSTFPAAFIRYLPPYLTPFPCLCLYLLLSVCVCSSCFSLFECRLLCSSYHVCYCPSVCMPVRLSGCPTARVYVCPFNCPQAGLEPSGPLPLTTFCSNFVN